MKERSTDKRVQQNAIGGRNLKRVSVQAIIDTRVNCFACGSTIVFLRIMRSSHHHSSRAAQLLNTPRYKRGWDKLPVERHRHLRKASQTSRHLSSAVQAGLCQFCTSPYVLAEEYRRSEERELLRAECTTLPVVVANAHPVLPK